MANQNASLQQKNNQWSEETAHKIREKSLPSIYLMGVMAVIYKELKETADQLVQSIDEQLK